MNIIYLALIIAILAIIVFIIIDLKREYGYLKLFYALIIKDDRCLYNYAREAFSLSMPNSKGEFMNDGYWVFEENETPQQKLAEVLLGKAKIEKQHRVLSLGCGLGGLEILCAEKYLPEKIIAIDFNEDNIRFAKENLAKHTLTDKHVDFMVGDATNLPCFLESGSFDRVFCLEAINDIVDQVALIKEVARMLKPDGVFVFTAESLKREPYTKEEKKMIKFDENLWSYNNGLLRNDWLAKYLLMAGLGNISIASIAENVWCPAYDYFEQNQERIKEKFTNKKYPTMTLNIFLKFFRYMDILTRKGIYDYILGTAKKSDVLNIVQSVVPKGKLPE